MAEGERLPPPVLPEWLDRQLPFDRYRIDVGDDLAIHVMEQGHGRPVVALHGHPTWGYLYRKVARQLRGKRFRLIMPDLLGLGMSDHPVESSWYTMANQSAKVKKLIEILDLQELIFVGQDWGGPIGAHALLRLGRPVAGMVILNTSLGPPRPGFKPTTLHQVMGSPMGQVIARYTPLPQAALGLAQGDRNSIRGEVSRAYRYPLQRRFGKTAVGAMVAMVPDNLEHPSVGPLKEVDAYIRGFDGPAHIVWGDRDPVLGRLRKRISEMLPQAAVTSTGAGHFLQEEVPVEIAAAISRVGRSADGGV